jgi:SAM-dependent methyltransferase
MYSQTQEFYDLIYSTMKDYPAEVDHLHGLIQELNPSARTVLDAACGTGEHARLLSERHGYEVDAVDLDPVFVQIARSKLTPAQVWQGSMTSLYLPGAYDVIVCLFSSIAYVQTLPRLLQTFQSFYSHLSPGGIILVEPWLTPEDFRGGQCATMTVKQGGLVVQRMGTTAREGRLTHTTFAYTIFEGCHLRQVQEVHTLGLWSRQEVQDTFSAAGLRSVFREEGPSGRGIWIARNGGRSWPEATASAPPKA